MGHLALFAQFAKCYHDKRYYVEPPYKRMESGSLATIILLEV